MKKLLIVFALIMSLNLSCETRMCGCGPEPALTSLSLIIKNPVGNDLLKASTADSYSKDEIQLYKVEHNGINTPLKFEIKGPVLTGKNKIDYYQLFSYELMSDVKQKKGLLYYLKFRDQQPVELGVEITYSNMTMNIYLDHDKLIEDSKTNTLFYFTKYK